jgi:hypothetical protein
MDGKGVECIYEWRDGGDEAVNTRTRRCDYEIE